MIIGYIRPSGFRVNSMQEPIRLNGIYARESLEKSNELGFLAMN